jgi:hypothetical protein
VKREEKRSKKSVEMRNEMTQVTQRIISRGKSWPIPTKQILSFPSPDNTYREERLSRTKRGNRIIKGGGGSKKDVRKKGKKKRREIKREKKKRHHPAGGTDNQQEEIAMGSLGRTCCGFFAVLIGSLRNYHGRPRHAQNIVSSLSFLPQRRARLHHTLSVSHATNPIDCAVIAGAPLGNPHG